MLMLPLIYVNRCLVVLDKELLCFFLIKSVRQLLIPNLRDGKSVLNDLHVRTRENFIPFGHLRTFS